MLKTSRRQPAAKPEPMPEELWMLRSGKYGHWINHRNGKEDGGRTMFCFFTREAALKEAEIENTMWAEVSGGDCYPVRVFPPAPETE